MTIRILLNGKKAGLEPVRAAILAARRHGNVEVRVTFEGGDIDRLVAEAVADACQRLVAAGGDGTVNECVSALMRFDEAKRPELAIMPLGTANDFATACTIPIALEQALRLAQTGEARAIDCVKVIAGAEHAEGCSFAEGSSLAEGSSPADGSSLAEGSARYFINVASGGFGAKVTAETPVALKNFLGGGAYTLAGIVQALSFAPYQGTIKLPNQQSQEHVIVGAICNGRQAGGGQQLAPKAMLNNGLLDTIALRHFPMEALPQVLSELANQDTDGEYVRRIRTPWVEWHSDEVMPINLDGEPIAARRIRFEAIAAAIKLVLPQLCPLLR
ncbi:YegS/Rv2252/BmrU family lipid kinase [Shewanella sp. 3B26]|uniref:YegS/Rv2252/BmrU family lipid kinase n=1 Tax=Shewanella zhuhaiensis TaxID=2919576 RepID=A0AAJ1BGP4_9GAMM|nr:YegS/Rv2252/BmrU family lipid kinase [Shewanella zhuhaiensis]MCH4293519.1 YegS/Rv2252/BmrU family lipid kinase [Shewanella zhuhaiensis]